MNFKTKIIFILFFINKIKTKQLRVTSENNIYFRK